MGGLPVNTAGTWTLPKWQAALPDVNPNTIADLYNRGVRVNVGLPRQVGPPDERKPGGIANPNTTNTIMGGVPQINIGIGQMGNTLQSVQSVLGHETVHAWQRYSYNPAVIATGFADFTRTLAAKVLTGDGRNYHPHYSGLLNQEGQASLYYGPPTSTYQKYPAWVRKSMLRGFLR